LNNIIKIRTVAKGYSTIQTDRFIPHDFSYILSHQFCQHLLFNKFPTNLGAIAHNVPAVSDVLAGRIGKPQVCSPAKMWVKWSVGGAADLAKRNPEPL
jgi:hypothetical protein